MKKITFSKMHGLGNDFMVIDATTIPFSLSAADIGALGDRKTGVGFDQLLVVEPATKAAVDFNYRIFNTDGSEVEHCGNGARCFAKFVKDKGLSDKQQLVVQVKKGLITITYYDDDRIEVDMGHPLLAPRDIPFNGFDDYQLSYELSIDGKRLTTSVVSMGNPHAVLFVDDVWNMDIEIIGKAVQQSHYFPDSVNVNFVQIIDTTHIELRTYERGVGETDACGTGACASAFATYEHSLHVSHQYPCVINVAVRGGALRISIDESQRIFMAGHARWVFDGELALD